MKRLSRIHALKVAAGLSLILGLFAFVAALPYLALGADELDKGPGFGFMLTIFIFAILRIVGAFGVWRGQHWGILLSIAANLLDAILALPGLIFAPNFEWRGAAFISVASGIIIIVLCLWRDRRPVAIGPTFDPHKELP